MKKRIWLVALFLLLIIGIAVGVVLYLFRYQPMPDLEQVEPPDGAQLLFFPIQDGLISAGFQNPAYLERFGYPHYGIDVTVSNGEGQVLAAGNGVVLGTEFCDNSLGYIAVIRHDDVFVPQTGEVRSLVGRYYHMISMTIAEGDRVWAGQVIGAIQCSHEWYNHVHLELEADLEYPFHTPQVAEASSQLLHRYPADGEQILEPLSVLVVGNGQRITQYPNARSCSEKDQPRFMVKR